MCSCYQVQDVICEESGFPIYSFAHWEWWLKVKRYVSLYHFHYNCTDEQRRALEVEYYMLYCNCHRKK